MDRTKQDIKDLGQSLPLIVRPPSSKIPSQLATPWQGWELEQEFLYKLHEWNKKHKDDKLPAVLAKVNNVLELDSFQAALEFIPDDPFPAKSLVKAMISLFQLGSVSDSDVSS